MCFTEYESEMQILDCDLFLLYKDCKDLSSQSFHLCFSWFHFTISSVREYRIEGGGGD